MYRAREPAPAPRSKRTPARRGRRENSSELSLQEAVGNRAFGQMIARKAANVPTVKLGKFTIVVDGDFAAWATAKDAPDTLDVTSEKGKHSGELAKLFKDKTKIKLLTLTVPKANASSGQHLDAGAIAVEIKNGRITDYSVNGKTETWQVAGFDGVHRTTVTRTVGAK
jgi:hypothetical protein